MNSKKDSKKPKPKTEEKFQSPQPKKHMFGNDLNELNLSDLSPFRPLYGSCHTPHYIHFSNAGMEFIETPAHTLPRHTYLDQIDESLKQISGIINFDQRDEDSEQSEDDIDEITDSESQGLEVCEEDIIEEQKVNDVSPLPEKVAESKQPSRAPESKEKKETKKPIISVAKPNPQKLIFCNCKKTKCLKLYCDCFRDNQVCGEGCNCVGCHNLEIYEDERNNAMLSLMDRNPEAFKPKIDLQQHSKGCHCKKSNCQKKYCECFQAGLKCGSNCKCEDCKNLQDRPCDKHNQGEKEDIRKTAKKERRYNQWHPAV